MCWSWLQGGRSLKSGQNPDPRSFSSHYHEYWRVAEVAPCHFTPFFLSDLFPDSSMVPFVRGYKGSFSLVHRQASERHLTQAEGLRVPCPSLSCCEEGQTSEKALEGSVCTFICGRAPPAPTQLLGVCLSPAGDTLPPYHAGPLGEDILPRY